MPRTMYTPPKSSPQARVLQETQSEPDISASANQLPVDSLNVTIRPGKRFRGDDVYLAVNTIDDLKKMLETWKAEQDITLNKLMTEIAELKQQNIMIQNNNLEIEKSITFINKGYEDIRNQLAEIHKKQLNFENRLSNLANSEEHAKIVDLESKIDSMEQQARQSNIEICNIPEKRNENLLTIMDSISKIIKYPVSQSDIISIHRVPRVQQNDSRPKNIIVKLKSKILRDNILSAYRKTNSIKSDQLGISGVAVPVYINEHLTLKNKMLFRKTREAARKGGFKYIWIKNATILARERDGSPAFVVRSDRDLDKFTKNK